MQKVPLMQKLAQKINRQQVCTALLILLTFLSASEPGGAESLVSHSSIQKAFPSLSDAEVAQLQKEGEITRYFFEPSPLKWLPADGLATQIAREASRIETVIGLESIHILPFKEMKIREMDLPDEEMRRKVYNVLRSVSTLKGVEYYSVTRGRMRTLFEESYPVLSLEQPTRVRDPRITEEIPPVSSMVIFQRDTTFGESYSRWVYRAGEREIAISTTNLTPLKYSFFRMVDPEQMQIHLLVRPMEGGISFYGCAVVKSAKFLGLEKTKTESFYNRVKALYSWFKAELTKELKLR